MDSQEHIVYNLHGRVRLSGRLFKFFQLTPGLNMSRLPTAPQKFCDFLYGSTHIKVLVPFQPLALHATDFFCILHVFCDSMSPWYHFFSPSIGLSYFEADRNKAPPLQLSTGKTSVQRIYIHRIVKIKTIIHHIVWSDSFKSALVSGFRCFHDRMLHCGIYTTRSTLSPSFLLKNCKAWRTSCIH